MLDLDAELEEYIGLHSEPEPEILQQLSRATHQKILRPRMLSGNLDAAILLPSVETAVTVTVPLLCGVTTPFSSTVAMPGSEEVHCSV